MALICLAGSAMAQDSGPAGSRLSLGGDSYAAAEDLTLGAATAGDLFAIGEDVTVTAPAAGAMHLAGRRVTVMAAPGRALYAMGYRLAIRADLSDAATLFGAEVTVAGAVAGNLRLFAREAEILGPLAGSAIVMAQDLRLDATITGDLMLAAEDVDWGPGARVDGRLIIYAAPGETAEVPGRVASPDRVEQRDRADFEHDMGPSVSDMRRTATRGAMAGFGISVVLVAALATAAVALAPARVATWRETVLARPGSSLGAGFLLVSALVGAGFVLALTIIGLPLLPALLLVAGLAAYAGYVLGSYSLGVGIWLRLGKTMPEGVLPKAGLAALGAVVAGLIGLIPFLGWLVVLALGFAGLGAIALDVRARRLT